MSRALAGVRARRGPLSVLAAMTTVVTAGTVTAVGFGEQAGTSPWLVLPLLLVGAMAVPGAGRELAVARREEIGLARLRGVHGPGLVRFVLIEPLLAISGGALAGLALGAAGTWVTTRLWLDDPASTLPATAVPVVVGVIVLGLLTVLGAMAASLREPLADQISIAARSRRDTTASMFGSVLVLVAAAVAIYRSRTGGEGDPDWVVLAGPALVGIAAGQCTVWLVRGLAGAATARTAAAGLPAFLATRRVGRTAGGATSLRLLVATGAVATLAATGSVGVAQWSDESARLETGAPVRVDLDVGAQEVVALADELDPDGRWIMPAVVVPNSSPAHRRVFLDTARFDEVVGGFYEGTPAAAVAPGSLDTLQIDRPAAVIGNRFMVTAASIPLRVLGAPPGSVPAVELTVSYVNPEGSPHTANLLLRAPSDGGPVSSSARMRGCGRGCVPQRMRVQTGWTSKRYYFRPIGDGRLGQIDGRRETTLTSVRMGDTELVDLGWTVETAGQEPGNPDGRVRNGDPGLRVTTGRNGEVRTVAAKPRLPVLVTTGLNLAASGLEGPGGDVNSPDIVEVVPALPFVSSAGSLADLRTALYGSGPTIAAAEVLMLARSDAPDDVLDPLVAGGGVVRTLDDVRWTGARESRAVSASVFALTAGCALLVALLALAGVGTRQRADYQREVAGLRVLGVPADQIRAAARRELFWLTTIAVVAGVGSGLLASVLLLPDLPIVQVPEFAIPVVAVSSPLPALGVGLMLIVIVVAVTGRSRRIDPAESRPAVLR